MTSETATEASTTVDTTAASAGYRSLIVESQADRKARLRKEREPEVALHRRLAGAARHAASRTPTNLPAARPTRYTTPAPSPSQARAYVELGSGDHEEDRVERRVRAE